MATSWQGHSADWVGYDLATHYRLLRRWSQQVAAPVPGWLYGLAWLALQVAVLVPLWRFFSWVDNPFLLVHFILMLCLSTSRNLVLVFDMAQESAAEPVQRTAEPPADRAPVLEPERVVWGSVLH